MYKEELVKAAKDIRAVTFQNGSGHQVEIRRLTFQVAAQFDRTFEFDVKGYDITVIFH